MAKWIALLRGINVGGHHKLPMQSLRDLLAALDYRDVDTYIQSGNAVFVSTQRSATAMAKDISNAVESAHGFRPPVQVLSVSAFRAAVAANPYDVSAGNEKHVHLFFLDGNPASQDLSPLDAYATAKEEYVLRKRIVYLHTPGGLGRSKVGAKLERFLETSTTARNLRSARRILALAEKGSG
ncbi:MAG: DUF1697 domain-containing protein [Gammaproteobacteria bacterium]